MAPTLFFQEGSYKGTAVKFKNFIVIGSADSANLKIDEQNISPLHIAFIKGNDGFYLLNLDENNNIYLNSEPIQYNRLNNEDVIHITSNCIVKFMMSEEEYNSFTPHPTHSNSKKKFNSKKNTMSLTEKTTTLPPNPSFIKRIFAITAWILLIISVLGVSFIAGIYTTDSILQAK